jgi:hypothetical protein
VTFENQASVLLWPVFPPFSQSELRLKFLQEHLGVLQVRAIEAFGEAVVDFDERRARFNHRLTACQPRGPHYG